MDILYTSDEYVKELIKIGKSVKTYYGLGAIGAPASYKYTGRPYQTNKERYKVPNAPDDSFIFDCAGFGYKALPWGWCGNRNSCYGGAKWPAKGQPLSELDTDDILSISKDISDDFSQILPAEILYMSGHVGVYIGSGMAIECTSAWTCGVLISEVKNCNINTGISYKRTWLKHAKLPFVNYLDNAPEPDAGILAELNEVQDGLKRAQKEIDAALVNVARIINALQ